jgi:hypothetical protein
MADLKKRRITVEFDCEHLENSPVLGVISEEFLAANIEEFFKIYFAGVDIHPDEGDFYKLDNPKVVFKESYDQTT